MHRPHFRRWRLVRGAENFTVLSPVPVRHFRLLTTFPPSAVTPNLSEDTSRRITRCRNAASLAYDRGGLSPSSVSC